MQNLDTENKCSVRSKGGYMPYERFGDKFENSFFPHISSLWNSLPKNELCKDLIDIKKFTNKNFKLPCYKHFSRGNKIGNSLLTKIRVGRSDLHQHRYIIGLSDSPECECHHREESPLHYFIDCFLYSPERQILFEQIEHYIPKFKNLSKQKKLEIILRGIDIDNQDFLQLNTTLTYSVQNFILHPKKLSD